MSDTFFFLGILFFFFLLWFASGGPSKPISFAGPYITPITNVGVTQEGYGDTSWTGSVFRQAGETLTSGIRGIGNIPLGETSPYHEDVSISGVSNPGGDLDEEYVTIRLSGSASAPVNITGWRLVSGATDKGAVIPSGTEVLASGRVNALVPIVLQPGDEAVIVTGESPIGVSFRENKCVGYLAARQDFIPNLYSYCPDPSDEYDAHYSGNGLKDTGCYDAIRNLGTCQVPKESGRMSSACLNFFDTYLNYNGCVAAHRGDEDFTGDTWRIYLDYQKRKDHKDQPLWKEEREGIKLIDTSGKVVDLYTY